MPDEDLTAIVRELYDIPHHRDQGIEVLSATRDRARLVSSFDESKVGNPKIGAIHGGVISGLIDVAGAAPFIADRGTYTPTMDLRIDYLCPAGRADLIAEATVLEREGRVGTADVVVRSGGDQVAIGRGVYKLSD